MFCWCVITTNSAAKKIQHALLCQGMQALWRSELSQLINAGFIMWGVSWDSWVIWTLLLNFTATYFIHFSKGISSCSVSDCRASCFLCSSSDKYTKWRTPATASPSWWHPLWTSKSPPRPSTTSQRSLPLWHHHGPKVWHLPRLHRRHQ